MASVRSFKKDIDYLLSLVLEDCVTVMENHPEVEREKVMAVAQQVILNHMELRKQVNHIDGKDNPAVVKKYMKTLAHKLYTVANDSLGELNKLVEK